MGHRRCLVSDIREWWRGQVDSLMQTPPYDPGARFIHGLPGFGVTRPSARPDGRYEIDACEGTFNVVNHGFRSGRQCFVGKLVALGVAVVQAPKHPRRNRAGVRREQEDRKKTPVATSTTAAPDGMPR